MADIPDGVKQPQDYRKPAAQIEAEGDDVTIDYDGKQYTLPGSLDDADGDVMDAIDDEKLSYALRALLGPAQWKQFKKTRPKVSDYSSLFSLYAKQIGLESTGE